MGFFEDSPQSRPRHATCLVGAFADIFINKTLAWPNKCTELLSKIGRRPEDTQETVQVSDNAQSSWKKEQRRNF